jgi:hypothetical protein
MMRRGEDGGEGWTYCGMQEHVVEGTKDVVDVLYVP